MSEGLDVEPSSRVAARRKAREQAAAGETPPGAVGGGTSSKPKAKGGRFGNRNTREKRRGTGVVTLQDDAIEKVNEEVKETTAYNEEITKPSVGDTGDHCGNGCSNGAAAQSTNGASTDVSCNNGAGAVQQSPRHRRQHISNHDETESHHNARRRQPEESDSTPTTKPTSILRKAEARASTDERSPEEWRRELEMVEDELDSAKEENRQLAKSIDS